jgi:sugar phosphate isomerase/epimerase
MGLTLDTGCFYWLYPLDECYKIIESFLSYVKYVHLKNQTFQKEHRNQMKSGIPVGEAHTTLAEGDLDLSRIVNMLKTVGYEGSFCIEDHSIQKLKLSGKSVSKLRKVMRKDIEFIRELL